MKMIPLETEIKIRDLLEAGTSVRQVMAATGVTRYTVCKIKKLKWVRTHQIVPPAFKILRKERRCPECGALVKVWPCFFCNYRKIHGEPATGEDVYFTREPWRIGRGNGRVIAVASAGGKFIDTVISEGGGPLSPYQWPARTPRELRANARLLARAPQLFEVASDIVELQKLHLFTHPLFSMLAQRAAKVIQKVKKKK